MRDPPGGRGACGCACGVWRLGMPACRARVRTTLYTVDPTPPLVQYLPGERGVRPGVPFRVRVVVNGVSFAPKP